MLGCGSASASFCIQAVNPLWVRLFVYGLVPSGLGIPRPSLVDVVAGKTSRLGIKYI
jgi:hypothetical protein